MSIAAIFCELGGRPPPADERALESALLALHVEGSSAWPGLDVAAADFVAHLVRRMSPAEIAEAPRSFAFTHVRDLYLACACSLGLPGSLATFDREHLVRVPLFLSRIDRSPNFADEVRQLVRERLFVAGKISEYSGRGALAMWLRMVAIRIALNLKRQRGSSLVLDGSDEIAARALPAAIDPELEYQKTRHAADFKAALSEALASLTSEERNLLRLYYVDGRTTRQIGALHHVDQSTAVRRLAVARKALREKTRSLLDARLGLAPGELDSLARLVVSRLDLSLPRLLATETALKR